MTTRLDEVRALCLALDGKLVAMHCDTDPVTGETAAALFTDDGRGNGDWIATLSMDDFLEGAHRYMVAMGLEEKGED